MAKDKNLEEKSIVNFPNPLLPEEEKNNALYGNKVGRAIWAEVNGKSLSFFAQRKRIVELRNIANDTPVIHRYKDQDVLKERNTSEQNINQNISTVIPNLVNISSNKLTERGYEIELTSIDKDSFDEFDRKMKQAIGEVRLRNAAEKLLEQGQDNPTVQRILADTQNAPKTEDDAVVDLEMNFKTEAEESYEAALRYIFDNNNIEEVEKIVAEDLNVLQRAGAMVYLDHNGDIRIDWVDQKNFVSGYCTHPDYSDARYVGVVRELKLSDVKAMSNGVFSNEDYFNMAKNWAADFGNDRLTLGSYNEDTFRFTQYADFKVLVLFYQIKLPNTIVTRTKKSKKGNTTEFDIVSDTYSESYVDKDGVEKTKRGFIGVDRKEVVDIYEGYMVCNTRYSWGWKKKTNMTRKVVDGTYSTDTDFDIITYAPQMRDMQTKSLVERMSPIAEQMTIIEQKMQQFIAKSRPAGVVLDVAALQGITMGTGSGFVTYKDAQRIFEDVGNLYINSIRADGEIAVAPNSPIVQDLPNGLARGMEQMMARWNQLMMQMYQISGLNPSVDGSLSSTDTVVGAVQAQQMAYNSSTKHLQDAYANIMQRIAERCILLVQNQMDMGVKVRGYKKAIGTSRTLVIEATKNIKMAELGIKARFKPTAQDKQEVKIYLQRAIDTDQISVGDAMRAEEILETSAKEASEFITRKVDAYARRKSEMAMQQSQADAQNAQAIQQAKAESEIQSANAKTQGRIAEIQEQYAADEALLILEYRLKEQLARVEGDVKEELIEKSANVESEQAPTNSGTEGGKVADAARKMRENVAGTSVPKPRTGIAPSDDVQQGISAAVS